MKKEVHVFDLDGTLVDSSHRYRTVNGKIDLQYWRDNAHKAMEDKPLPLVKKYRKLLKNPAVVVVVATARLHDEYLMPFLEKHDMVPHALVARREGDESKGVEMKTKGLWSLELPKKAKYFVYEDNAEYLSGLMRNFNAVGHYFPSNQGH